MHAHLFNPRKLLYTAPQYTVADSLLSSQKAAKLIEIQVLDHITVHKPTSSANCMVLDRNANVYLSTFSSMCVIVFIAYHFGVPSARVSTYQDINPHKYLLTIIFPSSNAVQSHGKPLFWKRLLSHERGDGNGFHRTSFLARSALEIYRLSFNDRLILPRIHRSRSSSYLT